MFSKSAVLYNAIFVLRRLSISLVLVFATDYAFLQIIFVIVQNLFTLSYLLTVRPFATKFQNYLEIFNETCVLATTYFILLFSDLIADIKIRYNLGWVMIGIVVFNILVNMVIMLIQTVKASKALIAKGYRFMRNKLQTFNKNDRVIAMKADVVAAIDIKYYGHHRRGG